MELALERKSKVCFRKISEQEIGCEASAECVVPDTQEDIRQVIGASFVTRLRSKEIEAGEICVKAELTAAVMYYSDNGIETLNMTLPVNARLPAADADSSCRLISELRVCSWEARLINPRKLSLTVYASAAIQCFKENELVWYGEPTLPQEKLYIKSESRNVMLADTVAEKEIIAAEDFELPLGEGARLISACASYHKDGSETVGDRLIVRCSAEIEAIFLSEGKITRETFSLPFSQLFDVDGSGTGCCSIYAASTGEYYDYSDGKLSAELHTALQLVYYKNTELEYSTDAYSCTNEISTELEKIKLCSGISELSNRESIQLCFEPQQKIAELIMTRAFVTRLEHTSEGISAAVASEIIYRDEENELRCGKVRGTAQFGAEYVNSCTITGCELTSIKASDNGDAVDLRAELLLSLRQETYSDAVLLNAIEIGDELEAVKSSAYIVITDDDLWSIAKKYRSDINEIRDISGSDGNVKKYFVPVIK